MGMNFSKATGSGGGREVTPVRNPHLAEGLLDLVTAKQLGMIRALARELGVNPEEECRQLMRCATGELSKRAASGLIDHLLALQKNAGVGYGA